MHQVGQGVAHKACIAYSHVSNAMHSLGLGFRVAFCEPLKLLQRSLSWRYECRRVCLHHEHACAMRRHAWVIGDTSAVRKHAARQSADVGGSLWFKVRLCKVC